MSENPQGVSFPIEQPERKPIGELGRLAERYKSERFIIDGVNPEARENNRLAVEAMQAAGEKLKSRSNEFFGIILGGSRILGCNRSDSDIDTITIGPDTTVDATFVDEPIKEELAARGIHNQIDSGMEFWTQPVVPTDPDKFIYWVEFRGEQLATLLGYAPYRNPNLDLTVLGALEVIQKYKQVKYDWGKVADEFARLYLGERKRVVGKLAQGFDISKEEVGRIFTKDLFKERRKRCVVEDPERIYRRLKKWHDENRQHLNEFKMFDVYNGVFERLREGF